MKHRSLFGLGIRAAFVAPFALAVGLVAPERAEACGGCFIPPGEPTVVTGHRMAMTVSPTQSVLWDSIQYSGEPEDFAWVLPVKKGARIEAANAAFFEVLEGVTATRIVEPYVSCGGGESGCMAEAQFEDASGATPTAGGEEDPVEVVHHGNVGPYETVTLATDTPGALNQWLTDHGYNVDAASQPIIDQYVAEDFDFIALRLQPGKGVQQMTPVRIISEGSNVTLPLRMVAIGTGAKTPIVLYVIGEGRYRARDFADVRVESDLLTWNFKDQSSNYAMLHDAALQANDGKAFLTSYAAAGVLVGPAGDQNTGPLFFPERYALQAFQNGESTTDCRPILDTFDDLVVHNPCPAGEPWDSPACGTVGEGELDARTLGCPGVEDVAVALEGLHLQSSWVTRLEGNLPKSALATDLVLEAAPEQTYESGVLQASIALESQYVCGSATPIVIKPGDTKPGAPLTWVFGATLAAVGVAFAARRANRARA